MVSVPMVDVDEILLAEVYIRTLWDRVTAPLYYLLFIERVERGILIMDSIFSNSFDVFTSREFTFAVKRWLWTQLEAPIENTTEELSSLSQFIYT